MEVGEQFLHLCAGERCRSALDFKRGQTGSVLVDWRHFGAARPMGFSTTWPDSTSTRISVPGERLKRRRTGAGRTI